MMKNILLPSFIILMLSSFIVKSQNLSAYVNIRKEFYEFEDSFTHQIDYVAPIDYKIGGNCIAYTNGRGDFRIYQYGTVEAPMRGNVSGYDVTNNLLLIKNPGVLYAYDQGQLTVLTYFASQYTLCDSLIAFLDGASRNFQVYYKGGIRTIEEGNTTEPAGSVIAAGSNIFAYVTQTNEFKIFYRDSIYLPETEYPRLAKAGTNVVAYLDQYDEGLRVFYKGVTKIIEPYNPRLYYVANDLIAYVTQDGFFKIFWKGNLYEIGNYNTSVLQVKDNLVIYGDRLGHCYVFYEGKSYLLENYIPAPITKSQSSLFYYDQSNHLKVFSKGILKEMPLDTYLSVSLDYDVLKMQMAVSQYRFFSDGKIY